MAAHMSPEDLANHIAGLLGENDQLRAQLQQQESGLVEDLLNDNQRLRERLNRASLHRDRLHGVPTAVPSSYAATDVPPLPGAAPY